MHDAAASRNDHDLCESARPIGGKRPHSFVVVNLGRPTHGVAEIESALERLGIQVDVIESGQRPACNAAVFRIPEQRVAAVMLALMMGGFVDVTAYEANDAL